MKEQVEKALKAISEANSVRAVRRAAHIAYVDGQAPGSPDQTALQKAVISKKARISPIIYGGPSYHAIGCGALTGNVCTCR